MKDYISACKAYDIRGPYGTLIDENFTYILGIGIARYVKTKNPHPKILIGSDVRLPNKNLITAFIAGLQKENIITIWAAREEGKDEENRENKEIYPYGICSTPMLYYLAHGEVDLAVACTASHNPPEDVGMKFFDKDCTFLSQSCVQDILKTILAEEIDIPNFPEQFKIPTYPLLKQKQQDITHWLKEKYSTLTKDHHIGIDFSTGAAVSFEQTLIREFLPHSKIINNQADGLFSAHLSETQDHENYNDVITSIQENNLELGCMFDGDADRVGFVGPDGKVIGGDIVLSIISEQLLKEYYEQQETEENKAEHELPLILYEVMCSQSIPDIVQKNKGQSKMVRMGRFFIKEAMEKYSALFAGETSGHFMFAEIGNYEMPLLAIYYVLKALEYYEDWNTMINTIRNKHKSPVKSKKVADKNTTLSTIKEIFSDWKQLEIDGISCYGEGVWFNIRASNTENKVRYTVEADTLEQMTKILKRLESILEK